MAARNHIDLTVKTMNVLESLAARPEGTGLKDVAEDAGLIRSSVYRILFTLKELGYVEQLGEHGRYRLTFRTLGLIRRSGEQLTLSKVALPYMAALRDRLRESVWLAEQRRHGIVLTNVVEAPQALQLSFGIGDLCPIHATALGKAIAAHLDAREVEDLLAKGRLPRFTSKTITRRSEVKEELQRVRDRGYALNAEETIEGAILAGAPVFDATGRVFAAISVSAPTVRCSPRKRKEMIDEVMAAGAAISRDLRDAGFRAAR
jgi:DNA-binding IclR family transcriptional regulator